MNLLLHLHEQLDALRDRPNWWLALSGGLDSVALAAMLANYLQEQTNGQMPQLRAIHVDHQLQPDSADWAGHCRAFCASLSIPLTVETVDVVAAGKGIEAAARDARYEAFARHCLPGDVLFTAHHANDQAETVLLRLLRGTGIKGAAGIAAQRDVMLGSTGIKVTVCRPLLPFSRNELEDYTREKHLPHIEDPSNTDLRYDRNFLRHQVLPLLESRWPAAVASLQRFAGQSAETSRLLNELAGIDLASADARVDCYGPNLSLDALLGLSANRQANLLRYWLGSYQLALPSALQTQHILDNLLGSASSQACIQLDGNSLRLHQQRIYLVDDNYLSSTSLPGQWLAGEHCQLGQLGRLVANRVGGEQTGLKDGSYRIGFRIAGDKYQANGMTRTIKKLFNERAIPQWLRNYYPVVYAGDDIAAVGDMLVCDKYRAPGGWQLEWQYNLHNRSQVTNESL